MLAILKVLSWKVEAILTEWYISIKPVKKRAKPHNIKEGLIVSLTSFPARFDKLHLTLKGLLLQSVEPDLLILWIGTDAYGSLSEAVLSLERRFIWFEIRACDDIRSYTKLVPTLADFSDCYIVTADDDLYYPPEWLEKLILQITDRKLVISHRVHQVTYKGGKTLLYGDWNFNSNATEGTIFATGIGGVLYPPNTFDPEVTNKEVFLNICASADDVWFFWMARKNGIRTEWSGYNFNIVNWLGTQDSGLVHENIAKGGNDVCIKNMMEKYGDIFYKISDES
jgi:hypothetical protein